MKWEFLKIFKRARSSRGIGTTEYALCCAMLCLTIIGAGAGVSRGVNGSFDSLHDAPPQSMMSCSSCSSSGPGWGGPEQFTSSGEAEEGGGSITSERPPSTYQIDTASSEPPPPPPLTNGPRLITPGEITEAPPLFF